MMLSCWLHQARDLQHVLERFAAECEVAGRRIKSEAMDLNRKKGGLLASPGWWRDPASSGGVLGYLRVLFTNEGKMDREIDRRIGAASAVVGVPDHHGEEGAKSKGEALHLPVNLRSHSYPTVMNFR
ncbi:hypothetical protein L3Q82_000656 [Scortum barcoo]|uniref:Uncharacterized protein n=1 Tax=Scortum barcoo TaxID=214431 RepID=A0ACB8WFQ8_9TELE|nr:hypothetical protein L3Q82_000656 [Scortum barcoo]